MAKAPRPGANRKADAIDQAEKAKLVVRFGNETYSICPTEISALDSMALRRETDLSGIAELFVRMIDPAKRDISDMAAVIWLARRATEPGLTFAEVAADVTLDGLFDAADLTNDDAEAEAPGEA